MPSTPRPSPPAPTTIAAVDIGALLSPTSGTVAIDIRRLDTLTYRDLADLRLTGIGVIFQGFNLLDALDAHRHPPTP